MVVQVQNAAHLLRFACPTQSLDVVTPYIAQKHHHPCSVSPPQSLDASPYIAKKLENRVDKVIKYMLVAGKKALADAGLPADGPAIKVRRQGAGEQEGGRGGARRRWPCRAACRRAGHQGEGGGEGE